MAEFVLKTFQELTPQQLYDILQLRADVFVVEQNCPYLDPDNKDLSALHLMCYHHQQLLAYARLLPAGISYPAHTSIGRVVSHKSVRKDGYGKRIMQEALRIMDEKWPETAIKISAQSYLEAFYSTFGFESTGNHYLEDDIPHTAMVRKAKL